MKKLVSIIMPMYNAAKFVEQAIQSVLNQTYPKWELLIINDGSTDDSLFVARKIRDARIRIFDQRNKGVSAARNLGLVQMRGDFFCFLDADDIFPPESIQSRLVVFTNDIDFVDGRVEYYDESGKFKIREWTPNAQGKVCKKLLHLDNSCFFGLSWMVKVQHNIHYAFDESLKYCEDLLFFLSIADSGNYAYTKATVLHYRQHATSAMQDSVSLANGYTLLRVRICQLFSEEFSVYDKFVYDVKVRKIMFLTFFRAKKVNAAIRYLLLGRL